MKSAGRANVESVPALAFIALGSNLGNSRATVLDAMARLQSLSDEPLRKSSLWDTTPVECPPGSPRFVNAVVALSLRAGETPETLLAKLQELEKEFGRQPKKVHNEARPLDLDLIAFGGEVRATPSLILPHPRARQRRFVLQPLSEIAPELHLPGAPESVRELLEQLVAEEAGRGSTLCLIPGDLKTGPPISTDRLHH